jgi:anti-sigma B factor antagonist
MKIVGDIAYISLNVPRLDGDSARAIKDALKMDFDPAVKHAEVEIGNVQFIDSSGIGVLLGIYRKLPNEDSRVILHNVQPGILAVLELLRLQRIFTVA